MWENKIKEPLNVTKKNFICDVEMIQCENETW